MFGFLSFTFIDLLDILLVGLLIFWIIKLLKGTPAISIFSGIVILYIVWLISKALNMKLLSFILGQVLGVGVIALVIIFQPEIRRFFMQLGTKSAAEARAGFIHRFFKSGKETGMRSEDIGELASACIKMSETKTGALIVLQNESSLRDIIETGDEISARISSRLIENIFFKNSPLHDGAMVISSSLIVAARCTLPITQRQDIPARYGMRHRAAVGISEQTDALTIVVSEETGGISIVEKGEIKTIKDTAELSTIISGHFR